MPDIRTKWVADALFGDWMIADGALDSGNDLATAVILSLFTDRRADDDDRLPDGLDRRGWWGDGEADEGPMGSRLWLLSREKTTPETRRRAETYAREALQWLVDDGAADSVRVVAAYAPGVPTRLDIEVTIIRGGAPVLNERFADFWREVA